MQLPHDTHNSLCMAVQLCAVLVTNKISGPKRAQFSKSRRASVASIYKFSCLCQNGQRNEAISPVSHLPACQMNLLCGLCSIKLETVMHWFCLLSADSVILCHVRYKVNKTSLIISSLTEMQSFNPKCL